MKQKQLRIIKCPICGCEYLPSEIYYPNDFLGKPKDIVKDTYGKILSFNGNSMNDTEYFKCYSCGADFEVVATTNFVAKPIGNSEKPYTTKLKKEKFFLDEI